MPPLPRETRQQILTLLKALPLGDTRAGRDGLLVDLPPALRDSLARSETKQLDLAAILDGCAAWPALGAPPPLQTLLENAAELVPSSSLAADLLALGATLPGSDATADPAERIAELEARLGAQAAELAALRAQLGAPGVPLNEVLLPGGQRLPTYLLVAHYTRLRDFVRAMAHGSTAMQPMRGRQGPYENLRAFARRAQRTAAALLAELGEDPP